MNLTITQDNTRTETINSSIIDKLYEIAFAASSDPNSTVSLTGRLESPKGYAAKVEWLNTNFSPDLTITVPTSGLYIFFEDSNVETVLLNNNISSDGEGISLTDAADCNLSTIFANNTNITSFNEFKYFTRTNKTDLGGALTFINCTNLAEIDLSELEVVLQRQFENTAITTVNAPKLRAYGSAHNGIGCFQSDSHLTTVLSLGHITGIVQSMFNNCKNLATVNLPLECTTIGENGFRIPYNQGGGKLTTINLSNITSIGPYAFCELRSLALDISTGLSLQLTTIGNNAFENCTSLTGSLNLPNLTSLGVSAFLNCSSLSGTVSLPSLTSFGLAAFKNCTGITSVNDLGSITGLPRDAFYHCSNLASIVLPSTCTSIGLYAFENDIALTNIDLSDVTIILGSGFAGCTNLSSITGTSNLTSIGNDAFKNCHLSGALTLPNLMSLGSNSFTNCTGITNIANLGNINTIPVNCFRDCSNLTSVIFPTTIRTFNTNCFLGCKIVQIILPYGYIGDGGYAPLLQSSVGENCRYLQYPSTTLSVGMNDIFRNSGANAINCLIVVLATTPPTTGYDSNNTGALGNGFNWGRPDKANWYVPDSVVNDYKSATGWSQFANKIYPISLLEIDSQTYWLIYQANKDYGVPLSNS